MKRLILSIGMIALASCSCTGQKTPTYVLSEEDIEHLRKEVIAMQELDQKYRSILALGTLDEELLAKSREMKKNASARDYLVFKSNIEKDLSQSQIDSLNTLQHELDFKNYKRLKEIIRDYGYPSPERIGVDQDHAFPILLHPPIAVDPQEYFDEMSEILFAETIAKRMDAQYYALFYDNIKAKVLKQPQLYGTNRLFDPSTRRPGLPIIGNIEETNKARAEIGLPALNEGEYKLSN